MRQNGLEVSQISRCLSHWTFFFYGREQGGGLFNTVHFGVLYVMGKSFAGFWRRHVGTRTALLIDKAIHRKLVNKYLKRKSNAFWMSNLGEIVKFIITQKNRPFCNLETLSHLFAIDFKGTKYRGMGGVVRNVFVVSMMAPGAGAHVVGWVGARASFEWTEERRGDNTTQSRQF